MLTFLGWQSSRLSSTDMTKTEKVWNGWRASRSRLAAHLPDELEGHPVRHNGGVPVGDVGEGTRVYQHRRFLRRLHQSGLYCVLKEGGVRKGGDGRGGGVREAVGLGAAAGSCAWHVPELGDRSNPNSGIGKQWSQWKRQRRAKCNDSTATTTRTAAQESTTTVRRAFSTSYTFNIHHHHLRRRRDGSHANRQERDADAPCTSSTYKTHTLPSSARTGLPKLRDHPSSPPPLPCSSQSPAPRGRETNTAG